MDLPADVRREKRRSPERRCIGCGRRGPQSGFLRLMLAPDSVLPLVIAAEGKEHRGRGAYLCRRLVCLDRALQRKAFSRAFRTNVVVDMEGVKAKLKADPPAGAEANNTAGG